jgi:hypothetical protein
MYVLCAGMYRACSTWQYDVVAHLLEQHRDAQRLGYQTGEEFAERESAKGDRAGWQVLKSHEGHRSFAKAIARKRAVAIYAIRDIRDVVVSLMHKRGLSFEQLLRQGMIHQVLVNDRFWSSRPNALVQRYERLVADPVTGVEELARHLGIAISPGEADQIASEYSFQTNRRRMLELKDRLRDQGVDLDDPSNLQYYDQQTLLHWNHMREGRPGNWREQATLSQRGVLSRLCDAWLVDHGYEADTIDRRTETQCPAEVVRREVELARAWSACTLRCASLRYPRSARLVKPLLGIPNEPVAAVPARVQNRIRVDSGQPGERLARDARPERRDDRVGVVDASSPGPSPHSLQGGPEAGVGGEVGVG